MKTKAKVCNGAAAALGCLLLAGCNPAPRYAKPPATTPVAFKEAIPTEFKEGGGWKIAQPGDDKLGGNWWTVYSDPQLSALEEKVATSNQTVLQAEANFRAARALVVSSRSQLFPTLTAGPGYTNARSSATSRGIVTTGGSTTTTTTTTGNTGTGTTGTGTSGTGTTGTGTNGTGTGTSSGTTNGTASLPNSGVINNFSLPFDVSYTVDLWHKVRNTVAANEYSAQASAADLATSRLSIQAEVGQDYFEVRALDAERKIYEDTVANYRQQLQLIETLFNAGIDSDEDVAQAQTQLDTATAQLTDLGVSRATYEHALAVLTGQPPEGFALPPAPFVPKPPEVPVAVPSVLLERRPDIAGAERRVASANAQIGVARAAYYPDLTLSAAGGFQTSQFLEWFNWPSRFWSLGPSLSETLFDVGARRGATEQAEANYDAAVASYRGTVLTAFQAVEDNLSTLRILSQEVVQEHTAVNSANRYLDLSLTRFRNGVDSYLNVITAENTLLTNRQTEVQIELRQMTASVSLVMALGGGWDNRQLPSYKQLLAKPGKWSPAGTAAPAGTSAAPNPPPLNPNLPGPGEPGSNPSTPAPAAAGSGSPSTH
jgi:NodT family efflux transporter outer membrane factor (OMF) lipoprotein